MIAIERVTLYSTRTVHYVVMRARGKSLKVMSISRSPLNVKLRLQLNRRPVISIYRIGATLIPYLCCYRIFLISRLHKHVRILTAVDSPDTRRALIRLLSVAVCFRLLIPAVSPELLLLLLPALSLYLFYEDHFVQLLNLFLIVFVLKHRSEYWAASLLLIIFVVGCLIIALSSHEEARTALLFNALMALS